ncbi:hypothetical protein P256_02103 [Acinetobacter nectaris CIP 110549]|uniref:Fimbrial-type adhesion domain-containing protein n=1 Tax=Acinetobacter nectaris CIP 110549 TaxID=1392540 RepID=V2TNW8_9GAMM|nr:fimbrial protein [Acinetobacter nectaris]ESK37670.1 hypothetical protein P256_02103 [Acinetobacter nectaris CIP 110549]
MKKSVLLSLTLGLFSTVTTHATDGTINITGKILDNTCKISTQTISVNLPTISQQSLQVANSTAGRTPFQISLSQCKSAGNLATYFEPGPTVDYLTGRLNNTSTDNPATNVQVQLLGSNNQVIPILATAEKNAQTNSQWVSVDQGGQTNLNYYAEYFTASGGATAGNVSTNVQYTIIYQ